MAFIIKVYEDSMQYFSFTTLDGQYEYTRLLFGYFEAPIELKKRLIRILNPFIRNEEVIVYIDDVLIPEWSIEISRFCPKF